MTHPFDLLPLAKGGGLIFTPCPGTKGVDLASSVQQLKAAGTQVLLTLMPTTEMQLNNAEQLPELCAEAGIQWFQLPIADDHAPEQDFQQNWPAASTVVLPLLHAGGIVAIHCKGGSGRTGLVAAQLLLELGYSKAETLALVQALRPYALTLAPHQAYFQSLAEQSA
jgi:protein-tyrosine phosphatase